MKQRLRTVKSFSLLSYYGKTMHFKPFMSVLALGVLSLLSANVVAASLEQAKQLHDRIAGGPASETTLQNMAALLDDGKPIEAAYLAMETPAFYSTTLKLFATPWTNIDQDIFAPLNDYSATVIGAVRDDVDFRDILQADMVYVGKNSLSLPSYNRNNNDHYQVDGISLVTNQIHKAFSATGHGLI